MSDDGKATTKSAFTLDEFKARIARVRDGMRKRGVDVLLATGPENIYYLSGYHTTGYHIYQAFVLPLDGEPEFVCRKLEGTNVQALSWAKTFHPVDDTADPLAVSKDAKTRLQELLQARHSALPQYNVISTGGEAHEQSFRIECAIPELDIRTVGEGSTRRGAEQVAASLAFELASRS